jgi:aryl-alcohol dehydrogenase-like predicted oxidoreductase
MRTNRLGSSDLTVSEIGLGCMSLQGSDHENAAALQRAVELGINFFDTADLYDHGQNEVTLGKALQGIRDKLVIASKAGNRWREDGSGWDWDPSKAYIKASVHQSLKRLGTEYLDLYQLHGGTIDDPIDETIEAFEELKKEGWIRHYGISSIRPNVIREYLKRSNIVSVMMQYSLLDRRPEETAFELLHRHGVSVIVRGPVAKGLLAGKPPKAYLEHGQAEVARAQSLLAACEKPKRSPAQSALRFALAQPAVATLVPGASTLAQLEENAAAANAPALSEAELERLRAGVTAYAYRQHR